MIAYLTAILTLVGVRALLTLGLNVQWGLTGLVNLGAVAFFAVGAYTSALSPSAACPASGVAAASHSPPPPAPRSRWWRCDCARTIWPSSPSASPRCSGAVLLNEAWLTHGANGVTAIPRPLHAWFGGHYHLFYLVLVLVAVGLVYAALERVRRSPFGRVLRAIREDEVVAAVAGKPVFRFKVQAFALGAGVAGLAGVLFAHYLAYVEPNMFLPQESLYRLARAHPRRQRQQPRRAPRLAGAPGLLEGSRFAKDVIPFLTGVRLAAAQQILVGVVLVVMMIRRPEGLLPEKPGSD